MKKTSLLALPEKNLAKFQSLQTGNDCAIHSLVAAIELLTDIRLDPQEIIKEVNRIWWRGSLFRLAPKSGITPPLQVRLLHYLAKKHNLPLKAKLFHLSPELLRATGGSRKYRQPGDNLLVVWSFTSYLLHGSSKKLQ